MLMMKRLYVILGLSLAMSEATQAALLYSRITESALRANANNAGYFGVGDPGSTTRINFDDVPIADSLMGSQRIVEINRVTVGIRRGQGAGENNVRVWAAAMNWNGTLFGSPVLLGNQVLPARQESGFITDLVTISNLNARISSSLSFLSGYKSILIGVQLSQDSLAGWRITTGADHNVLDFANLYEPANSTSSPYFMAQTPYTSFYIQLEGQPVPEPFGLLLPLVFLGYTRRKTRS